MQQHNPDDASAWVDGLISNNGLFEVSKNQL